MTVNGDCLLLVGSLAVDVNRLVDLDDVVKNNPGHKVGGFHSPPHCVPRDKANLSFY